MSALGAGSILPHGAGPARIQVLDGGSDFVLKHVSIFRRRLEIGMAKRFLHQFQIAGLAQQLRANVVAKIVESKILDPGIVTHAPPPRDEHP